MATGSRSDSQGNVAVSVVRSVDSINFGGGDIVATNAMTDAQIADFTTSGAFRWQRRLGSPDGSEGIRGVAVDGVGNEVVAGATVKAIDLGGGLVAVGDHQFAAAREPGLRSLHRTIMSGHTMRRNNPRARTVQLDVIAS